MVDTAAEATVAEPRYDEDFYAWTQHQAARIRALRPRGLDWENLAQEVADLGRSEVNAVRSQLQNMLVHILKAYHSPRADAFNHWMGEVVAFRADAVRSYERSMRQLIEPGLDDIYVDARKVAELRLGARGFRFPQRCPLSLAELLDKSIDPADYVAAVERAAPG